MNLTFSETGWEHYLYWQQADKKITEKINELIKDCKRSPFKGLGKPEALKGEFRGFWSRRITDEHRLVYRINDNALEIVQCRYHY
jgi:toxin YoeB